MTVRTERPPAATALVVSHFGMALVLMLTGGVLTQLARCCDGQGEPPPWVYTLAGVLLAVGLIVVAVRLWRGALSRRAALLSEALSPAAVIAAEVWGVRYLGWQPPLPLAMALVVVLVTWWVLAWRALRRSPGESWLRPPTPGVGP
ncbi:hypothetical protein ABEG17_05555 [Pedococcus sp. KACC 23699]|uniref:Integral membrane protein n=1 Tax=Pedococcus sp. KACC 23699 TaxID=3149228 RepID=A0AAU7JX52_9MICO